MKKLEQFDSEWTFNLTKCTTTEDDIEAANRALQIIQMDMDEAINEVTRIIFDNNECIFTPCAERLEKRVLGELIINQRPERKIFSNYDIGKI